MRVRLHVNVDHVATLRQARGSSYPDPVEAAVRCEHAGADGITVHLREDRRHIQDDDVIRLRAMVKTVMNLEIAGTEEMISIAREVRPEMVTLVPERRMERTTEGGLDAASRVDALRQTRAALAERDIRLSLFIDPDVAQVEAAAAIGADVIELHTGDYAHATERGTSERELDRLAAAAARSLEVAPRMVIAAGHGLTTRNVTALVEVVPALEELNIGHALVSDALFTGGLEGAIARYRAAIDAGERRRSTR